MASNNFGWYYAKKPEFPYNGAGSIFELRSVEMPKVDDGMFLTKLVTVTLPPHNLAALELPGNDTGAESLGFVRTSLNTLLPTEAIAEVVETKSKKYKIGDKVWLPNNPLVQYAAFREDGKDDAHGRPPMKLSSSIEPETWLSTVSTFTGTSAYCAVNHHMCGRVDEPGCWGCMQGLFAKKKQKTVLVTSAAGGVGIVACQLYKNKGCKVIGVTGTREKADKLLQFGCDATIAYKTENMDARLSELAPEGVDVFFDNVGSTQLDAGTKHMKVCGKIISVGCLSEIDRYTTGDIAGWKEYHRMVARELLVGGFLLVNHIRQIPLAMFSLIRMLKKGKLKPCHTMVDGDFKTWADAVDQSHSGNTFGRLILRLQD